MSKTTCLPHLHSTSAIVCLFSSCRLQVLVKLRRSISIFPPYFYGPVTDTRSAVCRKIIQACIAKAREAFIPPPSTFLTSMLGKAAIKAEIYSFGGSRVGMGSLPLFPGKRQLGTHSLGKRVCLQRGHLPCNTLLNTIYQVILSAPILWGWGRPDRNLESLVPSR